MAMAIRLLFIAMMSVVSVEAVNVSKTLIVDTIHFPKSTKLVVAVNYSSPGPLIEVNEGDILHIRVINKLAVPTTIHWHGMAQIGTADMDGAVGLTQCPILPTSEMTYIFKAEPAGTTWYHGHFLNQYTDGLIGPLIIRRNPEPNADKYDSEHTLMITDWYNDNAGTKLLPWYLSAKNKDGIQPVPDAFAVNGKFSEYLFVETSGSTRILLRIINAAAYSMFTVSIDGLPLHIIELDLLPVVPYTVSSFVINVGQRVLFYIDLAELDQSYRPPNLSTPSVYIRFLTDTNMYFVDINSYIAPYADVCLPYPVFLNPQYLGILSLNSTNSLPTYAANQPTPNLNNLTAAPDTNILDARPFYSANNTIPNATHYLELGVTFAPNSRGLLRAYFNNFSYGSRASKVRHCITANKHVPLLFQIQQKPGTLCIPSPVIQPGSPLPTIQRDGYGNYLVPYNAVVDVFLNNTDIGQHPFHLHGYSFWIIATSENPQAEQRYMGDYITRDVVSVPAGGWAKLRFLANNPGAWLFHCHVEWHLNIGLAIVMVVAPEQVRAQNYKMSPAQSCFCQLA